LFAVLERWLPQQLSVIIISAAIFACIHFTSGVLDTMLNAFVHGVFFGIAYRTTRRLSICVVSHYLIDLLIFGNR
jgi:membrane protease YdiL (CAAX protease family)